MKKHLINILCDSLFNPNADFDEMWNLYESFTPEEQEEFCKRIGKVITTKEELLQYINNKNNI